MNRAQLLHKKAQEILASCKEDEKGCLVWQGPIDEGGYGYVQFSGQRVRIQTIVGRYGVEREQAQIDNLKKFRTAWTCGNTLCMRLDSKHMRFTASKPEREYETLVKWWEPFQAGTR